MLLKKLLPGVKIGMALAFLILVPRLAAAGLMLILIGDDWPEPVDAGSMAHGDPLDLWNAR